MRRRSSFLQRKVMQKIDHRRYLEYLRSPQWREKAEAAKLAAGGKCQLCSSSAGLNVHHRTYDRLFNEHPSDLICLCRQCHRRHHGEMEPDDLAWDAPC